MAQQTCSQLQADIARSNAPNTGFNFNNLTPAGLVSSIGDAFGSRNKTQSFNTNINNTSISTTDIKNIFNNCSNMSSSTQINNISSSPECLDSVGRLCNGNFECIRNLTSVSGINQENNKTVNQDCIINSLIRTISSKNVSMENAAQLLLLQEAKGLMTSNDNLTSNCNQVNNNITSNAFLSAIANCANKSASEQINTITACGNNISGTIQRNQGNSIFKCYVEQGLFSEDTIGVKSFNKALLRTTQKADSSMSSMSSIMIIVVLIILGIVGYIMYQNKKKQHMQQ